MIISEWDINKLHSLDYCMYEFSLDFKPALQPPLVVPAHTCRQVAHVHLALLEPIRQAPIRPLAWPSLCATTAMYVLLPCSFVKSQMYHCSTYPRLARPAAMSCVGLASLAQLRLSSKHARFEAYLINQLHESIPCSDCSPPTTQCAAHVPYRAVRVSTRSRNQAATVRLSFAHRVLLV